jgi:uncharacterized protein YhdP
VVDDFELRGRRLGRLEVEAQNRALDGGQREWRLAKFSLITPEAQFQASGNWASLQAPGLATGAAAPAHGAQFPARHPGRRATAGAPGSGGALRRGKGRMEGMVRRALSAPTTPP